MEKPNTLMWELTGLILVQALVFCSILLWLCHKEKRSKWWALAGLTPITFVIAFPLIVRE